MGKSNKHEYKKLIKKPTEKPKFIDAIWAPELRDWRDLVEDYVEISRKRFTNKLAMFHLQLNILTDLITSHEGIRGYSKLLKNPESAKDFIKPGDKIDEYHINHWTKQKNVYDILSSALKEIGDGILWRALSFDRSLTYVMSANEPRGLLTTGDGLTSELGGFMELTNDVDIKSIVFNDITNFGKVGDVTTVDFENNLSFVEIKSGENARGKQWKERIERQKIRGDNLSKIANEKSGLLKDKSIKIVSIKGAPHLSIKSLRKALLESDSIGISSYIINDYLGTVVIDQSKIKESLFKKVTEEQLKIIGDENSMFTITSMDRVEFSHNNTPYSVYPISSTYIADILLGKKVIFYRFNIRRFIEKFKTTKWKVVWSILDNNSSVPDNIDFCVLKKDNLNVSIPITLMSRVMYEGFDINSIIKIVESDYHVKNEESAYLWEFDDESKLWA